MMKLLQRVGLIVFISNSSFVHRSFAFQSKQGTTFARSKSVGVFGYSSTAPLLAKPKRGTVVDSYQTISVNCAKCGQRLFRYKKKNGTKSNLVKCFVERISEDSAGVLQAQEDSGKSPEEFMWTCPSCETQFGRSATIKGLPAIKMVGGKIRMTKK
jgi:hypothetical protein